jgi:hypothetical protein
MDCKRPEHEEKEGKTGEVGLPAPSRLAHSPAAQGGIRSRNSSIFRWRTEILWLAGGIFCRLAEKIMLPFTDVKNHLDYRLPKNAFFLIPVYRYSESNYQFKNTLKY